MTNALTPYSSAYSFRLDRVRNVAHARPTCQHVLADDSSSHRLLLRHVVNTSFIKTIRRWIGASSSSSSLAPTSPPVYGSIRPILARPSPRRRSTSKLPLLLFERTPRPVAIQSRLGGIALVRPIESEPSHKID